MIPRRRLLRDAALLAMAPSACAPSGDIQAAIRGTPASPGANAMRLIPADGRAVSSHPLRIGRPFRPGAIARVPAILADGVTVPTQADVKTRWPDGSVRHAVLSCMLPRVPGGGASLAFADQPAPEAGPLSAAEMLDPSYDFDAVITLNADGQTSAASARAMLQAGAYIVWASGPIATTIILADHSAARRYDIGPPPLRSIRPIFHATFWPALRRVALRIIAENANTRTLADVACDVQVTVGHARPVPVIRQAGLRHYAATRWSRRGWLGAAPAAMNTQFGLAALADARALPPFDTMLRIPDSVIAQDYADWLKTPRGLFQSGGWAIYMPTTGGRDDLGHVTGPIARWLFSGDHRMERMVLDMAELAGAWPLHVREGDPDKIYDPPGTAKAIGLPVSVYARPSLWLLDPRSRATPADQVAIQGTRLLTPNIYPPEGGGWYADGAHQPDPYSAPYLLTGDPFLLEQCQMWAATQVMAVDPGYRDMDSGLIEDQVRGEAWTLRTRVQAATLSPDGTPQRAYFARTIDDAVAYWEGVRGITGTRFQGGRLWQFGAARPFDPPLRFWGEQEGRTDLIRPGTTRTMTAPWQTWFMLFELAWAREQGFPVEKLLDWASPSLLAQFRDPSAYDPANVGRYVIPIRRADGQYFPDLDAALAAYVDPQAPPLGQDTGDGYPAYATAAAAMLADRPEGAAAYAWLRRHFYEPNFSRYAAFPKWAVVPRTV